MLIVVFDALKEPSAQFVPRRLVFPAGFGVVEVLQENQGDQEAAWSCVKKASAPPLPHPVAVVSGRTQPQLEGTWEDPIIDPGRAGHG